MNRKPHFKPRPIAVLVSTAAASIGLIQPALAQDQQEGEIEEVLVSGIRASIERAMDMKREATGVVDAISAEDMGKFPDSNLAESLQRITGVSINRVNGEGSEVTVRGFGGSFNMVTLNGRQMPAANVASITGNPLDQGASGTSRSFDFSNLASEGVSALQVYKTGRASVPTGGVGASINIQTIKPLDAGTRASFGAKAVKDTSGDDVTPELSGLYSWANSGDSFGVAVFGSYQERDFGSRTMSVERYDLATMGPDTLSDLGMSSATVVNTPNEGQLVAIPSNIGLGANRDERTRINGQLTLQYKPSDSLTFTVDANYAQNEHDSTAIIDGIWFARNFTRVEFDGNPVVATPIFLQEDIDGGKDFFFQNLTLATKDTSQSFGFNTEWQATDKLNLKFDIATSEAESTPNGPYGKNSIRFNVAGATAGFQTAVLDTEIPQASIVIDDSIKGNNNGVFDFPDVGTQVTQAAESNQKTTVDQFRVDGIFDFDGGSRLQFGTSYVATEMHQRNLRTQGTLGGWGVDAPGDIPEGLLEDGTIAQTCTGCEFSHDINGVDGQQGIPLGSVSFSGDSVKLLEALGPSYGLTPGNLEPTALDDNLIKEDIFSTYAEFILEGELSNIPTTLVVGARYEYADIESNASVRVPEKIIWLSDNDFLTQLSTGTQDFKEEASYNNFLPNIDLSFDLTDNLKGRVSYSKTMARPEYHHLTAATSINNPPRPTALGGAPSGSVGNAKLIPLESNNYDLSLEWYYGDSSYFSVGYYKKNVSNFVGTEQISQPLFDLRDPTSGESGTLSGDAIAALEAGDFTVNERNFFTMAAVLDNPDAYPNGAADFNETQLFADAVFGTYDIEASGTDPEFQFELTRPINNRDAEISGFEIVSQHFFGESGFGYQANFTTVEGDIGFDNGSSPDEDQFALEGLSDTANFVFIFEKYGLSARLAYNWRDDFLNQVNRSVSSVRNPEYIEDYAQWDMNISYNFNDNLSVSLDAINITEEDIRHYGRSENNVFFIQELDARYMLGLRYSF